MTRAAMRAAERKSVPASRSGVNDAKALPKGPSWLFEGKWDGYRCLVLKDGRKHGKERAPTGYRGRVRLATQRSSPSFAGRLRSVPRCGCDFSHFGEQVIVLRRERSYPSAAGLSNSPSTRFRRTDRTNTSISRDVDEVGRSRRRQQ